MVKVVKKVRDIPKDFLMFSKQEDIQKTLDIIGDPDLLESEYKMLFARFMKTDSKGLAIKELYFCSDKDITEDSDAGLLLYTEPRFFNRECRENVFLKLYLSWTTEH